MRGFMLLIGLAFFAALGMAPARAVKLGETCDGIAAIRCDEGLWCEHPDGQCMIADGSGTCAEDSAMCEGDFSVKQRLRRQDLRQSLRAPARQGPVGP